MANLDDSLLQALISRNCRVDVVDGGTLVSLPDDYLEFVYERQGEWLYLGVALLGPEDIAASPYAAPLDRFLLELQDRNLGCHFSYDRDGVLSIGVELYPVQQTADILMQIMDQVAFVTEICILLSERVLDTGEIPSDAEVDDAFGGREHLH